MPANAAVREYVLVHGAWHGSWCWELVAPKLAALGHTVHTPDLPGAAGDDIPPNRITLNRYVDSIAAVVEGCAQPPIVVGHSMAGIVITQLGERLCERMAALVYLAAFLPRDGESLAMLAGQDPESLVSRSRQIDTERGVMTLPAEMITEAFYGLCPPDLARQAIARLHPEPLAPSAAPVSTTTQRFGRIPRSYIECRRDRAITLRLQRMMHSNTPCPQYLGLDTDHSPFYSAPDDLVARLVEVETSGWAK